MSTKHQQTLYTVDKHYGTERKRIVGHICMNKATYNQLELVIRSPSRTEIGFGPKALRKFHIELLDLLNEYGIQIGGRKGNVL